MSMIRQHNIAKSAFDCVDTRDKQYGQDKANKKSYGALAHKLPMLIMQNGMAQATGFLWAKGSNEHLKLMDDRALTTSPTPVPMILVKMGKRYTAIF